MAAVVDEVVKRSIDVVIVGLVLLIYIIKFSDIFPVRIILVALWQVQVLVVEVFEKGGEASVMIVTCKTNDKD